MRTHFLRTRHVVLKDINKLRTCEDITGLTGLTGLTISVGTGIKETAEALRTGSLTFLLS